MKLFDSHRICLKKLLSDVAVGIVEFAVEISPSKGSQIAHAIDEKLRVGDVVFLLQFIQKLFSGVSTTASRKSCPTHDFRIPLLGSTLLVS